MGHTPGSIALLYRDPSPAATHLFTGDSLFPGGVGNTDGTRRTSPSLIDDVERKLFDRLPDDTWFYPGHGKDSHARRASGRRSRSGAPAAGELPGRGYPAGQRYPANVADTTLIQPSVAYLGRPAVG